VLIEKGNIEMLREREREREREGDTERERENENAIIQVGFFIYILW
jgi:hypothetical protein